MIECTKWEDFGLLYTSGELENSLYDEHLKNCSYCLNEFDRYKKEQKQFFRVDILGEAPSVEIDNEILRVCSRHKIKILSFSLVRKILVPAAIFIIGLVSAGYLVINMENAKQIKNHQIVKNDSLEQFRAGNLDNQSVKVNIPPSSFDMGK